MPERGIGGARGVWLNGRIVRDYPLTVRRLLMATSPITPDLPIDPARLDAWISMQVVQPDGRVPDAPFIYLDDLLQGFPGHVVAHDVVELTARFAARGAQL